MSLRIYTAFAKHLESLPQTGAVDAWRTAPLLLEALVARGVIDPPNETEARRISEGLLASSEKGAPGYLRAWETWLTVARPWGRRPLEGGVSVPSLGWQLAVRMVDCAEGPALLRLLLNTPGAPSGAELQAQAVSLHPFLASDRDPKPSLGDGHPKAPLTLLGYTAALSAWNHGRESPQRCAQLADAAACILERGVDVRAAVDPEGNGVLAFACGSPLVERLLAQGADAFQINAQGVPALGVPWKGPALLISDRPQALLDSLAAAPVPWTQAHWEAWAATVIAGVEDTAATRRTSLRMLSPLRDPLPPHLFKTIASTDIDPWGGPDPIPVRLARSLLRLKCRSERIFPTTAPSAWGLPSPPPSPALAWLLMTETCALDDGQKPGQAVARARQEAILGGPAGRAAALEGLPAAAAELMGWEGGGWAIPTAWAALMALAPSAGPHQVPAWFDALAAHVFPLAAQTGLPDGPLAMQNWQGSEHAGVRRWLGQWFEQTLARAETDATALPALVLLGAWTTPDDPRVLDVLQRANFQPWPGLSAFVRAFPNLRRTPLGGWLQAQALDEALPSAPSVPRPRF